jgi:hypothetical protein
MNLFFVFTPIFGILFALYNAYIFAMSMAGPRDPHYNKLVHRTGAALRLAFLFLIVSYGIVHHIDWVHIVFHVLFAGIFFWPVFNVVYGKILHNDWFYIGSKESGTKSLIDLFLGKSIYFLQVLLILLTGLWYVVDFRGFFETMLYQIKTNPWEWIIATFLIVFTIAAAIQFRKK